MSKRVAIVTGSSRGLGKKTAYGLAADGFRVVVNYRNSRAAAEHVVDGIRRSGGEAVAIQADVSDREQANRLVAEAVALWQRADVLVNNAGPFIRERKRFADYTAAETDYLLDGNLLSALSMIRAVLPHMRREKWGRIIQFGFARAGEAPAWPDRAVYAAANVGLVSFTKSLSVEEAPYGITVNMVAPGDIVGENKEKDIADVAHIRDAETPRGRPGTGEDVVRVVRFLCEENADFFTGNVLHVTGGLDAIHPVSKAP